MKTFLSFTITISLLVMLSMYVIEKNLDIRYITPTFEENRGIISMNWESLSYPCKYRVETFYKTTGLVQGSPSYHLLKTETVTTNQIDLFEWGIPVYYRLTAVGLFGDIPGTTNLIENPLYTYPLKPRLFELYDKDNPASLKPFLLWHKIPNAVCYELEILDSPTGEILFTTRQIYTNGYQVDLREYQDKPVIYWRIRGLGLHHEILTEFSDVQELHINTNVPFPDHPFVKEITNQLLYPVYEWVPLNGIRRYEVELSTPSTGKIWSNIVDGVSSCYDEYPRPYVGAYYWRVRGIDEAGNSIGTWSEAVKFEVVDHSFTDVAVLGDSVSHGGGAVSYSPASCEYSYTTYLDFPAWNMSRSGDTSTTTLARFETDVLPVKPRNLIIMTGTNSLRSTMISAEDVIKDLSSFLYKCEEHNIRPIFLTLMPINPENIEAVFQVPTDPNWLDKMKKINRYIRSLPYYVDIEPYFYDSSHTVLDYGMSVDGLHPDIKGKQVIGEVLNQHKNLFVK